MELIIHNYIISINYAIILLEPFFSFVWPRCVVGTKLMPIVFALQEVAPILSREKIYNIYFSLLKRSRDD